MPYCGQCNDAYLSHVHLSLHCRLPGKRKRIRTRDLDDVAKMAYSEPFRGDTYTSTLPHSLILRSCPYLPRGVGGVGPTGGGLMVIQVVCAPISRFRSCVHVSPPFPVSRCGCGCGHTDRPGKWVGNQTTGGGRGKWAWRTLRPRLRVRISLAHRIVPPSLPRTLLRISRTSDFDPAN